MVVDLVQDGHITLAAREDEHLPREWNSLSEIQLTCLGRFSVYLIHVPVVRSGDTRLVIGAPDDDTAVQRRAYARVLSHVPVSCAVLDRRHECVGSRSRPKCATSVVADVRSSPTRRRPPVHRS